MKPIRLKAITVTTTHNEDKKIGLPPTAAVVLVFKKREFEVSAFGDGCIDAACETIDKVIEFKPMLVHYGCDSVSGTTKSPAKALFVISHRGIETHGVSRNSCVIISSILAYVDALNRMFEQVALRKGWPREK